MAICRSDEPVPRRDLAPEIQASTTAFISAHQDTVEVVEANAKRSRRRALKFSCYARLALEPGWALATVSGSTRRANHSSFVAWFLPGF